MIKRFLERCVPIPCTKPVSLLLQCSYLEARIYHLPAEFGQQALSQWSCSRGGRSKWGVIKRHHTVPKLEPARALRLTKPRSLVEASKLDRIRVALCTCSRASFTTGTKARAKGVSSKTRPLRTNNSSSKRGAAWPLQRYRRQPHGGRRLVRCPARLTPAQAADHAFAIVPPQARPEPGGPHPLDRDGVPGADTAARVARRFHHLTCL